MDKKNNYKSFTPKIPNEPLTKTDPIEDILSSEPKFQQYKVKLTGVPLNIRSSPDLKAMIIRIASSPEEHTVINEVPDWIQLENNYWVMKKFTTTI